MPHNLPWFRQIKQNAIKAAFVNTEVAITVLDLVPAKGLIAQITLNIVEGTIGEVLTDLVTSYLSSTAQKCH